MRSEPQPELNFIRLWAVQLHYREYVSQAGHLALRTVRPVMAFTGLTEADAADAARAWFADALFEGWQRIDGEMCNLKNGQSVPCLRSLRIQSVKML